MKNIIKQTQAFTLLEVLVAVSLFSMMALVVMDTFDGTKKSMNEMVDREEVFANGVKVLTELQDAVHQAAEIYNHVPVSSTNDAEMNLFFKAIDWTNIPTRMGTNLDYDSRLPDFAGQTKAISDWKIANPTDDYALTFHENDLMISLPPTNGPGVPVGTRGYAGNMLLIAKHLPPIEVVLSPTDTSFEEAKINVDSHLYGQVSQKGNQVLYYTGNDAKPGVERMYSVDVVRFEVYYLIEEPANGAKKMVSTTSDSVYREKNLRLVKAESTPYLVYDKFKVLKRNLDIAYHLGDPIPPAVVPVNPNPDDFPTVFKAINSSTTGVYFDNINKNAVRDHIYQTIEYVDKSTGPVIRNLTLAGADGFSSNPTGGKITFPANAYKIFISNTGLSSGINLSVGYNTKWTDGKTLNIDRARHIPWFAQQPDKMNVSPKSEYFPSGFEISGSGFGVNQRVGIRLCLWLRRSDSAASYSHYVLCARAQ